MGTARRLGTRRPFGVVEPGMRHGSSPHDPATYTCASPDVTELLQLAGKRGARAERAAASVPTHDRVESRPERRAPRTLYTWHGGCQRPYGSGTRHGSVGMVGVTGSDGSCGAALQVRAVHRLPDAVTGGVRRGYPQRDIGGAAHM